MHRHEPALVVTAGGDIGTVLVERCPLRRASPFWIILAGLLANLRSVADHSHLTVVEGDVTVTW